MSNLVLEELVLSTSNRPRLLKSEIELCWIQRTDLEFGDSGGKEEKWKDGSIAVTSHRLLWLKPEGGTGSGGEGGEVSRNSSLPLSALKDYKGVNSFFKKTPRFFLKVWRSDSGKVASAAEAKAASSGKALLELDTLSLAFRGASGSYDTFEKNLKLALAREEWRKEQMTKEMTVGESYESVRGRGGGPTTQVGASAAGIGGIMRKQREDNLKADKSIDVAFKDLSALMDKAREMVGLSSKLKEALQENTRKADDTDKEDKGIEKFLLSLGITSPVTKSTAGSMFHQQLAQQLADFLTAPLKKSHGAIALVDVYCIFNRARGIELVSPEDLIEAANLFPRMGINMHLREFESGTLAIQSSEHSDEALYEKLQGMTRGPGGNIVGIGPDDVAAGLDIPFILAREYLFMAEGNQMLCRDDGPDGLRFYDNFFKEVQL
ncbi:vacuolar protein sorting-associated protein [Chloropicon primus]|uniref:Vacuolar protein-sorting-associated protein 36 n=1 Tax=Chloropicon primus TaxID=1764295 RepID=A0A5B8MVG1_9CHLO|nr:vacuolar protein sorting-associated protein [Chloropicon primus]UPR03984.1 vacuolar protein sorting-associated protein [Chloropicon primus]|mmetsp:Transcript_9613/g.27420  ORF Transcript_9613/g.27420 Transcript_9613/m.27420 type:complete len:435 (-) Transcript_9613:2513-3817(-)|eukprot:QDZ24778.1 vacuolar protein sorting-associated protein [Chloropicon primus]